MYFKEPYSMERIKEKTKEEKAKWKISVRQRRNVWAVKSLTHNNNWALNCRREEKKCASSTNKSKYSINLAYYLHKECVRCVCVQQSDGLSECVWWFMFATSIFQFANRVKICGGSESALSNSPDTHARERKKCVSLDFFRLSNH